MRLPLHDLFHVSDDTAVKHWPWAGYLHPALFVSMSRLKVWRGELRVAHHWWWVGLKGLLLPLFLPASDGRS